jgi:hypothetical protein
MLLPIGVLELAAVTSLFARGRSRVEGAQATQTEVAVTAASTAQPLIREGEPV